MQRLLEEGVTLNDITILVRKNKNIPPIADYFDKELHLSVVSDEAFRLDASLAICMLMDALRCLSNPENKIAEAALMKNYKLQMTNDEQSGFIIATPLPETFTSRRETLRLMPLYELLEELFSIFGMSRIEKQDAYLFSFFDAVTEYLQSNSSELASFIRYWDETLCSKTIPSGEMDGIRILSIHKSKGLEFPVVIVADCAKQFNDSDLKEPVLVHQNLGFGSKCRDRDRGVQYDTAERIAVSVQMRREMISEELRVLYVAMTRAKEKLILTAATGSLRNSLKKWSLLASLDELPQYAMGAARTPLAWILTPLLRHPCARAFREEYAPEVPEHGTDNDAFTLKVYYPSDLQPQETEILRFEDRETGDCTVQPHFDYPHAYLADLPSKLTATGVGRGYRADEAAEQTPPPRKEVQLRAPLFEQGEKKLTPAEIGTAHHLFMQFCDFDAACAPNGVENELNRLAEKKILSTEQAHAVDKRKIERFFASDLYKTFMVENKVRREFKFSVLVPAQAYFPVAADAPEENVLLQGVIDCLIETRDGFVILDFKTDRIKKGGAVERAEQYRPQLAAYARAVHEIYGRPVRACVLYFFHTGDTEWVSLDED